MTVFGFNAVLAAGAIGYLLALPWAFAEAERKNDQGNQAPTWHIDSFGAAAYYLLIFIHILAGLAGLIITVVAMTEGIVCGLGALLAFTAPTTGFFIAITMPKVPHGTLTKAILWRVGVFAGISAVMLSLAFAACSAQPFKL